MYNRDDCHALVLLWDELARLGGAAVQADPLVDFADRPKQFASEAGSRVHMQFAEVLKSAHASYQKTRLTLEPERIDRGGGGSQEEGGAEGAPRVPEDLAHPRRSHRHGSLGRGSARGTGPSGSSRPARSLRRSRSISGSQEGLQEGHHQVHRGQDGLPEVPPSLSPARDLPARWLAVRPWLQGVGRLPTSLPASPVPADHHDDGGPLWRADDRGDGGQLHEEPGGLSTARARRRPWTGCSRARSSTSMRPG